MIDVGIPNITFDNDPTHFYYFNQNFDGHDLLQLEKKNDNLRAEINKTILDRNIFNDFRNKSFTSL